MNRMDCPSLTLRGPYSGPFRAVVSSFGLTISYRRYDVVTPLIRACKEEQGESPSLGSKVSVFLMKGAWDSSGARIWLGH